MERRRDNRCHHIHSPSDHAVICTCFHQRMNECATDRGEQESMCERYREEERLGKRLREMEGKRLKEGDREREKGATGRVQ